MVMGLDNAVFAKEDIEHREVVQCIQLLNAKNINEVLFVFLEESTFINICSILLVI